MSTDETKTATNQQPDAQVTLTTTTTNAAPAQPRSEPQVSVEHLYPAVIDAMSGGDVLAVLKTVKLCPRLCACFFPKPSAAASQQQQQRSRKSQTLLQIFSHAGLFNAVKFLLQFNLHTSAANAETRSDESGSRYLDVENRDADFRTALHWAAIGSGYFLAPAVDSKKRCNQVRQLLLRASFLVTLTERVLQKSLM